MKNIIAYALAAVLLTAGTTVLYTEYQKRRYAFKVSAAENEYLRVISDDTPFYADKTATEPLFFLPYTYYVKVLNGGETFTHIEYGEGGSAIDGFVPSSKLFYDGLTVENPFPKVTATTLSTAVLYQDVGGTKPLQYIFEGRQLYCYGNYPLQSGTLYYVGYNNRLGYVKEADLVPFTIPYHQNELTFLNKESDTPLEPEPDEEQSAQSAFNLRVAVITLLGLAGVIALAFAFTKKSKASPAASYYDENDYE